jgi:hypothetical protein
MSAVHGVAEIALREITASALINGLEAYDPDRLATRAELVAYRFVTERGERGEALLYRREGLIAIVAPGERPREARVSALFDPDDTAAVWRAITIALYGRTLVVTTYGSGVWDLWDTTDPDDASPILTVTDGSTLGDHGLVRTGPWRSDPIERGAMSAEVEQLDPDMEDAMRYHLGILSPAARPGMRNPRPVLDASGRRVGWADSDDGPALVGPLSDADLAAWEADGRYVPEPEPRRRAFWLRPLEPESIGALDLRAEVSEARRAGLEVTAYAVDIEDAPEAAEAVVIDGRLGIAWGAPADWGSVRSADRRDVARALDDWLNDADAWEARR